MNPILALIIAAASVRGEYANFQAACVANAAVITLDFTLEAPGIADCANKCLLDSKDYTECTKKSGAKIYAGYTPTKNGGNENEVTVQAKDIKEHYLTVNPVDANKKAYDGINFDVTGLSVDAVTHLLDGFDGSAALTMPVAKYQEQTGNVNNDKVKYVFLTTTDETVSTVTAKPTHGDLYILYFDAPDVSQLNAKIGALKNDKIKGYATQKNAAEGKPDFSQAFGSCSA